MPRGVPSGKGDAAEELTVQGFGRAPSGEGGSAPGQFAEQIALPRSGR